MKFARKVLPMFLILIISGCTVADGQTTVTRKFNGIDGVALLGSGDLDISIGNKEEITIYAPSDLIPYLLTEMKDGTLYIGKRKKGWKKFKNWNKNVRYKLTVKSISYVSVSGSGDIDADKLVGNKCTVKVSGSGNIDIREIDSDKSKVHVSGSGDIEIANLSADILGVTINGSGDVDINGTTDELDVTLSGSGDFKGKKLEADNVSIDIYGSGDASIWATDTLNAHTTGSGDVIYHGDPSVKSRSTGSGDVRHP